MVEEELGKLQRFGDFLRSENKKGLDDLLDQWLYASYVNIMASPVKALPLIMLMLFEQHKRLMELEKRIGRQTELLNSPAQNSLMESNVDFVKPYK